MLNAEQKLALLQAVKTSDIVELVEYAARQGNTLLAEKDQVMVAQQGKAKTETIKTGHTAIDENTTVGWEIPFTCLTEEQVMVWDAILKANPNLAAERGFTKLAGKEKEYWIQKRLIDTAVEREGNKMAAGYFGQRHLGGSKYRPAYLEAMK